MSDTVNQSADRYWTRVLWLVVGGALLIRIWGSWYGLPFSYYDDEYHEVMRALELGMGSFNLNRTGKGGFYFLLFFEYGVYFVLLKLMGVVATAEEFARMFVRDPTAFYLMGRVTAAVMASMTVAVVFFLARQAYSTAAGLMAALFLAVNTLHVDLSRSIGVDVPMLLMSTLALYFAMKIVATGDRKDYLLAALCAALATTTKLPGILVLVPLLIAHTYYVASAGTGQRGWFGASDLWLAGAVFAGVLLATNPGLVPDVGSAEFVINLFASSPSDMLGESAVNAVADYSSGGRPNLYQFYLSAMQDSMGWPLFLIGLSAVVYALWKRTPADVILLSYAFVNYFVIASTTSTYLYYPRYAFPVIVVLAILSGRALAALPPVRRRPGLAAVVALGCVALPIGQSIATARVLTQTDTRTLAKNWFEANVPSGSRVLIEGGKIAPSRTTVQLQQSAPAIQRRIEYWKVEEPKQAKFLELQLAVHEGGGYDLEFVSLNDVAMLDEYAKQGIEYCVIRPDTFMESRKASVESPRLVQELRSGSHAELIKRFAEDLHTRPGPAIEIYRLKDRGSTVVVPGHSGAYGSAHSAE
jgi:4-amino-4-deoxy-L-arabinose transferase-like glycosyltransferase